MDVPARVSLIYRHPDFVPDFSERFEIRFNGEPLKPPEPEENRPPFYMQVVGADTEKGELTFIKKVPRPDGGYHAEATADLTALVFYKEQGRVEIVPR